MTLLFWPAKTTLPWLSKTADNGDPSDVATVAMVADAPAAAAALEVRPTRAEPATTEHATATTARTDRTLIPRHPPESLRIFTLRTHLRAERRDIAYNPTGLATR